MNQAQQFLNNMHQTRPELNRLHEIMQVIEAQLAPVTADTPVSVIYRLSDLIETANALQKKLMEQHFSNPSISNYHGVSIQSQFPRQDFSRRNSETPNGGWVMRQPGNRPTLVMPIPKETAFYHHQYVPGYTYDHLLIDLGDKEKNTLFMDFHFKLVKIYASNDLILIFEKKLENKISSEDLSSKLRSAVLSFGEQHYNKRVKLRMVDFFDTYINNIQEFKDWISAWWKATPPNVVTAPSEMIDTSDTIGTTIKNFLAQTPEPVTMTGLLFWINHSKKITLESKHSHVRVPRFKLSVDNSVDGCSLLSANFLPGPDMTLAEAAQEFEQTIYYSHNLTTPEGNETADGKRIVYLKKQFEDFGDQPGGRVTDPRQYFEWLIKMNSAKKLVELGQTVKKLAESNQSVKDTHPQTKEQKVVDPITLKTLFEFAMSHKEAGHPEIFSVPNFRISGQLDSGKITFTLTPVKGKGIFATTVSKRLLDWLYDNKFLTVGGKLKVRAGETKVYLNRKTNADGSRVEEIPLTDPSYYYTWTKNSG